MNGNAHGNPWKYMMVTRSKKALKASIMAVKACITAVLTPKSGIL